ncbi:MAG TPA: hypothetical protein VHA33_27245 [Candidatus Angelobacter sp.]|nr:hypothetical protein [Candidatus Angelobacter sp.]
MRILFVLLVGFSISGSKSWAQPQIVNQSGWVVIPVAEYQALHAKAFPTEVEPEPPAVDATLTRVDYDLQIKRDIVTGHANLTIDVLKDGWVRVPIPANLLVREARLDGKLVSLVPATTGKGSGQLSAVLSHPGRSVLLLDVVLPIDSSAGEESISLPSTASGVTRASILLPRLGVDVRISGGLLSEKSESDSQSKWLAYARGNEPLRFTWKRKTEDHRITLPLRMRGSLTELFGLGEDSTSVYAEVNVDVVQGAASEISVQLPDKVTINQVSGATVADWEIRNGELAVKFLEPVEKSARFVITGETRTPREGKIEIPLLRLLKTERETGGVAVEVLGAGEIKDFKPQGLESADATDLGEMIASRQSPSLAAFTLRAIDATAPRSLTIDVARYTQEAVLMAIVEEARYSVLMSSDGKTLVQARYAIRNNQRNFLKITLPAGATIWSASLAGKPIRPGQATDGSLLLPLEKSRASEDSPVFIADILYVSRNPVWGEKGKAHLALPAVDLPVSRTGLLVYHPPLFKVTAEPGPFRVEPYERPSSVAFNPGIDQAASSAFSNNNGAGFSINGLRGRNNDQTIDGQNSNDNNNNNSNTQALVDKFRTKSQAGKVAGILPIKVSFPAFGPSVFLVSELTSENQAPAAEFDYQRDKKGGSR